MLQIEGLTFAHAGELPIAAGWSAAIGPGVTLLHGDTGSGKTTLLRIIAGSLPAGDGRLTLAGTSLDADRAAYLQQVFFCDPVTEAFDAMTGHECTAALRAGDLQFDMARWEALVDGFSLAPQLEKRLFMLSTGSKRKVWLAAALASGRALTLLDEPDAALDAASRRCLWEAVGSLSSQRRRAIVVGSFERIDAVSLAATIELPLSA